MRIVYLLLLFVFILSSSYAQDIIVKQDGDTIYSKITSVEKGYIYYLGKDNIGEQKKYIIPVSDVKYYVLNSSDNQEILSEADKWENDLIGPDSGVDSKKEPEFSRVRLGLNAGFGVRMGAVANDAGAYEEYINGLRTGLCIDASITFLFNKKNGLGLKYNLHRAVNDDYDFTIGKMKDEINISYVGAYYHLLVFDLRKHSFYLNFGLGYTRYTDYYVFGFNAGKIYGDAVGVNIDIGYDFKFSRNVALSLKMSEAASVMFNAVNETGGGSYDMSDVRENLSHFDLLLGIKFMF
ncbi:MAG: hypothetical protein LBQ22_04485 [Bacteroidales bacterium]|jgi:hypothetical protein|nr:hypothetical protein [Bacteroidales bacterium]